MAKKIPAVFTREATGLVRGISLIDAIVVNLSLASIVYAQFGLLLLPFVFAGASLTNSVLLSIPGCIAVGVVYWLFNVAMPRSGGDYVYQTRVFPPFLGFASNFSWVMGNLLFIVVNCVALNTYGITGLFSVAGVVFNNQSFFSFANLIGSPNGIFLVATVANVLAVVVVAFGLKPLFRVLNIIFVLGAAGTILAILLLVLTPHSEFVSAFSRFGDYNAIINEANSAGVFPIVNDWNQWYPTFFGMGSASATLSFFVYSTQTGGELKRVRTTAPIALFVSFGILGLFVFLMAYAFSNTIGSQFLGSMYGLFFGGSSKYPFGVAGPSLLMFAAILSGGDPVLFWFMGIGVLLYLFVNLPVFYLTQSRGIMAWSFDRVFPEPLSRVNDRFHSPINSVIFMLMITEFTLIPVVYATTFSSLWVTVIAALFISGTITVFLVGVAGVAFPYVRKNLYDNSGIEGKRVGHVPLITLGGLGTSVFMGILLYAYMTNPGYGIYNPSSISLTILGYGFGFCWFIAGMVIYLVSRHVRKQQGIDFDMIFKLIPPE